MEQDGKRLGAECGAVGWRQATAQISNQRSGSRGQWAESGKGWAVSR